ncbi:ArsR/SmtB family transcription factor [Novosphingopyxis sp.]|uniref:ArsR/SmtB family transcription factor n=1 Tax=Novosphingopyxis sp. TaxID=2709690 RepID=UPI003B5C0C13
MDEALPFDNDDDGGLPVIMRALADDSRIRIMLLIVDTELAVGEIAQILEQSQPRASRHIRILCNAGLAERRREGSWTFLRPGNSAALPSIRKLMSDCKAHDSAVARDDRSRLTQVRAERARSAEAYFEAQADKWDEIRSFHVAEAQVEAAMLAMIGTQDIGRLLDIGTGTGRMIELFGPRARAVCGIDKSPDMLRLARAKLDGDLQAELLQGDFNALPLADASMDMIVCHQVLHYAQAPERVIAEAARVLAPEGCLMIVDFAPHELEELRGAHAHARLGFSDAAIARWFDAAGLKLDRVETLEGGTLDVKIWLGSKAGPAEARPRAANDRSRHRKRNQAA